MAAALNAFASKLAFALAGMAKDEVEMLLGVPGEITKLETTLGDLSSILGDAEKRRIRDSAAERCVRELKDAMYDADNILDLCQIMEGVEDPSLPRGCCSIPMTSCFRNPIVAHGIGKKIQALNQRLLDIEKRSSRFGFVSQAINSSSSYSGDRVDSSCVDNSQKTAPAMIRSDIVGDKIEQDTRKLVNLLVKKMDACAGSGVAVVVITGTGGIGKSTLARMVFNDNMVAENFDKKIWLSVNKDANEFDILQSVVTAFGVNCNGFTRNKALLEDALKQVVMQKKFLLVMDDVWSEKVWNELLRGPLNDGASKSRVLVTTRNVGVARGMRAHHIHQVDKLGLEDAWSLLKKQVILNESDEYESNGLKDVGMKIVEKCDGLPLAVKVVGGLLLNKSRTRGAWMDVLNYTAWSITEMDDDLNRAVYVSYEELPPHLKQCLLYCSLFPKGEIIFGPLIVRLWMAEGFVQNGRSSKLPEDLGLEFYRELISRNLLQPNVLQSPARPRMHHADGWCSLQELGSLSKLKTVTVRSLEKAPSGCVAARAKLSSKPHLKVLGLSFTSRLADNGEVVQHISKEDQKRSEDVLGNLCPPPSVENLVICGYIGRWLPQWMRMISFFECLRRLDLLDYACCGQLPNGLGQLPFLDVLCVECAPSIECISHGLLLPSSDEDGVGMDKAPATAGTDIVDRRQCHPISRGTGVAFPKLNRLIFTGILGWREWEWEEQVPAMPALEKLWISSCKLSHLPPGLAYHAKQLRMLDLRKISCLVCVEKFPSLIELWLCDNPRLERIANNQSLLEIIMSECPRVKVLEDLPSLQTMKWRDLDAEALPDYLREAEFNRLDIHCSLSLLKSLLQVADSEWGKIQHVQQLKAYGYKWTGGHWVKNYILYTKEPYSFETDISETSESTGEM